MMWLCSLTKCHYFLLGLLLGCGFATAAEQPAPRTLLGIPISFTDVTNLKEFGLNSILMVPRKEDGGGFVVLAISRRDLTEEFIREFFTGGAPIVKEHPFGSNGIEAVLRETDLLLKVHSGVALHLRQGTPVDPWYKTFTRSDIRLRVVEHAGRVFVSTQPKQVQSNAKHLYTVLLGKRGEEQSTQQLPDGSTLVIGAPVTASDFPPTFRPRIER